MSIAKGVVGGPITPSISHCWINSMGWPRSKVFSEDWGEAEMYFMKSFHIHQG